MSDFRSDFGKVLKRAGDRAELVVRKSALNLLSQVVQASPVDTGRFKSNWQTGIGAINSGTDSTDESVGRFHSAIGGWTAGQTIWLTNSLPYAKRLEYGWSKQAPGGMVRIAVQDFKNLIQQAAKDLP